MKIVCIIHTKIIKLIIEMELFFLEFESCISNCVECESINVVALGEDNLYICRNTEKILEKVDESTLKEM